MTITEKGFVDFPIDETEVASALNMLVDRVAALENMTGRRTVVDNMGRAIGLCDGGGLDVVSCNDEFPDAIMTFKTQMEATLLRDMLEAGGACSLIVEKIEDDRT